LGQDFLSPVIARLLVLEPIRRILPSIAPRDEVFEALLERSFIRACRRCLLAEPFLKRFQLGFAENLPTMPVVIFNATSSLGLLAPISNVRLDAPRFVGDDPLPQMSLAIWICFRISQK
jgi:hypothetical protein